MNRDKAALLAIKRELVILHELIDQMPEDDFLNSEKDQRAVMMTLLNIGELIKHMSAEFRKNHTEIPWQQIAGLRDMVAHTYFKLNMRRIWISLTEDIPLLESQIDMILAAWSD